MKGPRRGRGRRGTEMSIDSSRVAGFPATTTPALSANYFQTPHPPRLLNQPISGAPGPRGGPLPCQPLRVYAPWGPHRHGDLLTRQAPGGCAWKGRGQRAAAPDSSCAVLSGVGSTGFHRQHCAPCGPRPPAWRGGSQSRYGPGFGRDSFCEPVLPTAANSAR